MTQLQARRKIISMKFLSQIASDIYLLSKQKRVNMFTF